MDGPWHDAALAYSSAKIRKKARRFPDCKGRMIVRYAHGGKSIAPFNPQREHQA
jgi:hypothetical protein